jgi:TonB family protein
VHKQSVGKSLAFLPGVFVSTVLVWTPPAFSAAEPPRATPTLEFEVSLPNETGLLAPGEPFNFSVRLKGLKPGREEDLVAVFESPAFPSRLVSLESDGMSEDLTASTRLSSPPMAVKANSQPIRVEVSVARFIGMRLHTVLQRTVYLTAGVPPSPSKDGQSSPAPGTSLLDALLEDAPATDRQGQPVRPLLPAEDIREENMGGGSTAMSAPLYWKQIGETVTKRWQQELAQMGKGRAVRGLRVKFQLYPGGFAQLIQIERSSGNQNVDEAALRAVLSLHPFPPFPPDVREPSVDVHVDLPGTRR